MSRTKIIVMSGKKQSGKSTGGKHVLTRYINKNLGVERFGLNKKGDVIDLLNNNAVIELDIPTPEAEQFFSLHKVKLFSFADPLKKFIADTFGIEKKLMYGTDADKNTKTHIAWDSLPLTIRVKYSRPRRGADDYAPASGAMTVREVMQVFGSDVCREMDSACWARALYNSIDAENYGLSVVVDCRFPNEVTMGTERDAKVIRLTRCLPAEGVQHMSETALDDFPLGEYSAVIHNQTMSIKEKNDAIDRHLTDWLR